MLACSAEQLWSLVDAHLHDDVQQLALHRNRFPQLSDADFRFFLQQIDGRQRTKHKLPSLVNITEWWYPVRLSCEQCSSEATARYKAHVAEVLGERREAIDKKLWDVLIDLTGGYGIDSYFLSVHAQEAHYIERDAELCAIAEHNFSITRPHVRIHHMTAETFLDTHTWFNSQMSSSPHTLIYLDPARRSQSGSKVFRIEDCEPNMLTLLPTLRQHASAILIKFSPMLDISAALQSLGDAWDIHIIAVQNEVKEVLFVSGGGSMHAVNLQGDSSDIFTFKRMDEKMASCMLAKSLGGYLYEPNAAIIKAGAYRLVGERYGLCKLDTHTHLYTSDSYLPDFPGRVWRVLDAVIKDAKGQLDTKVSYSIISRNYPLSPEQIRKKYKLKDGNDFYLIGARLAGKPQLVLCQRVEQSS